MITLQELMTYLTALLPSNGVCDYCPNGLQVEGKKHIQKAAIAVSASLAAIESAVSMNADALIVHHGLFWQKDSYVIDGVKQSKLKLLLENGISLIAYHLPLDMHPEIGNNWAAAKDLGWKDLQPFGYMGGVPIGVKGSFPQVSRDSFQSSLEHYYGHSAAVAPGGKERVSSAALISGGAYRSITDACQAGVDCFVTGNFDEPAWHIAFEEKINFFALGHFATERVGPIALGKRIVRDLGLLCEWIDQPNPF